MLSVGLSKGVSPVLSQALCVPVEVLLNQVLKQDPAALQRLSKHEGRMMGILITDRMVAGIAQINVRITRDGLNLSMTPDIETDVVLSGSTTNFIKLARATDKANELINSNIDMDGNTELALAVTRVVQTLDIDWEALIQPFTGGILAHQIGKGLRGLLAWGKETSNTYRRAGKEYLEDEVQLVAPAPLLDQFNADVDQLRLSADRLEARIARLENKKNPKE